MKDIMLINPSSRNILKNAGDRVPLGLLYLATTLTNAGHKVRVRDLDHISQTELYNEIEKKMPEYVGVSVFTSPMFKESIEIANYLKEKCKTIAGGHHATALPQSLTPYFDTVVTGEADFKIVDIVEKDLTGIVESEFIKNIDNIPVPERRFVNMNRYNYTQDGRKSTTLISSRGCPNACVYCSNHDKIVRQHSIHHIMFEIEKLKGLGYNDLYFYDDNFITGKQRTIELIDEIKKENINYRFPTRAKSLDEEIVSHLKDSGCSWIGLGIESGSDDRLKDVNKHMTTEDNLKAVKLLTKCRIKSKGFFMFGLPNETIDDAIKTIEFSQQLKREGLTSADFYILTPYPGTDIWNNPDKFGIEIVDRDYTKYIEAGKDKVKSFIRTKFMDAHQIENMRDYAEEEWKKN